MSQNTKEEVQKAFDLYDVDGNQTLSKSEFRAIMVKCGMRDENVKKLFDHVDCNKDGDINSKEFIKWIFDTSDTNMGDGTSSSKMANVHQHVDRLNMTKDEALEDFFLFMDDVRTNARYATLRDQIVLDPSKLKKKVSIKGTDKVEPNKPVSLNEIFKAMDTNNNGKVTMSEFVSGCNLLGIDCEDGMLANLFRVIDQEKKMKKKIVVKGGMLADHSTLSAEEVEAYTTAAITDNTPQKFANAKANRKAMAKARVAKMKADGLDAVYISSDEEEFHGLKAQTGVTTEFTMKDGVLDLAEFKKAFTSHDAK